MPQDLSSALFSVKREMKTSSQVKSTPSPREHRAPGAPESSQSEPSKSSQSERHWKVSLRE
jgi:hypothetical protein